MKILKHILHFFIGSVVLCGIFCLQKIIAGDPMNIKEFFIPLFFGGTVGVVIGYLFMRLREKNRFLQNSNEEFAAANEELTQSFDELRNVYNELQVTKHKAFESDRLKSSFLSNLSHEIRTPLNGIVGFAQMLGNEDISAEDRQIYVNNLMDSTDRLIEIVSNTVEIAKIEAGSVELARQKASFSEILKQVYSDYEPMAVERGLAFDVINEVPESKTLIHCDSTKLKVILKHLVHNALKFTPEGSVQFGAEIKDAFVEFFVEDTGLGIDKKDFQKIFNPFAQGETLSAGDVTGTGLGLAIAKYYVELMGGMLELESEKGKGSRFSFLIPYERAF